MFKPRDDCTIQYSKPRLLGFWRRDDINRADEAALAQELLVHESSHLGPEHTSQLWTKIGAGETDSLIKSLLPTSVTSTYRSTPSTFSEPNYEAAMTSNNAASSSSGRRARGLCRDRGL